MPEHKTPETQPQENRQGEKRPLPKAETFEITIDFGPHQARHMLTMEQAATAVDLAGMIGRALVPHIEAMLKAEEKNHADSE